MTYKNREEREKDLGLFFHSDPTLFPGLSNYVKHNSDSSLFFKKRVESRDLDSINPQDMQQLYVFKLSLELQSTACSPDG